MPAEVLQGFVDAVAAGVVRVPAGWVGLQVPTALARHRGRRPVS
jgi:hypothetical protein